MIRGLALLYIAVTVCILPAARAQQPDRVARVGVLVPSIGPSDSLIEALRRGLRDLGYVEGKNIRYEFRSAQGRFDRLPALAEELSRLKVDVIVAGADPAIQAAVRATHTIPIVMVGYVHDPVASGLIDSYGKPGRNLTGVFARISELVGKRFQLLKEVVPNLSRVAVFWDISGQSELAEVEPAARSLGLRLKLNKLRSPYDFEGAFKVAKTNKAQAVVLLFSSEFYVRREQISAAALKFRLPTATGTGEYTEAGALLSYGPEGGDAYRRAADFVDRLLKGAKPSDLPVEQAAEFKLLVNLKTAEALGLTVPESILLAANKVIR